MLPNKTRMSARTELAQIDNQTIGELIHQRMSEQTLKSLLYFLNDVDFGTFSLIIHDGRIIGYDTTIKRREI